MLKVDIPKDVEIKVAGKKVFVKGPKGELSRDFGSPRFDSKLEISCNDSFAVECSSDDRKAKAMAGTVASHVQNMIKGVTAGFECRMKIFYTHFPVTVSVSGTTDRRAEGASGNVDRRTETDRSCKATSCSFASGIVEIRNFLGEKGARKAKIVGSAEVRVEKDMLILTGTDKESVGQTAANIEAACRISKRDRRVFQDGIYIVEKPK